MALSISKIVGQFKADVATALSAETIRRQGHHLHWKS
jgi:hypothetical protein